MLDVSDRSVQVQNAVRLLDSQHLPNPELRKISKIFEQAAGDLLAQLGVDGVRLDAALARLWEAKNEAVGHAVVLMLDEGTTPPITHRPGDQVP